MVLDQKFSTGFGRAFLQLPEQLGHLGGVEVVNGEPLVDGGLDGMCDMAVNLGVGFLSSSAWHPAVWD